MKKSILLLLLPAFLLLVGCSTTEKALFKEEKVLVRAAQTNRVTIAQAAIPDAVAEAQTMGAQVIGTNMIGTNAQLVTVMPEKYEVRYTARPAAQSVIRTAGDLIPLPGAGIIGMALSSLLTAFAGWKTAAARGDKIAGKMAVSMDEYRNTVKTQLAAFNQTDAKTLDPDSFDAKALKALKMSQRAAGYGEQIAKVVHRFTGHTSNR